MRFIGDPNDLYKTILNIIRKSRNFIYIVSPYMGFETNYSSIKALRTAFNDAIKRNVKITIITRGKDAHAPSNNIYKIRDFLSYSEHIYLVPYLHAKVYCNETCALVTSLNLSISSLFNQNKEIGILIERNSSKESNEYRKIISYANSLKNTKRW